MLCREASWSVAGTPHPNPGWGGGKTNAAAVCYRAGAEPHRVLSGHAVHRLSVIPRPGATRARHAEPSNRGIATISLPPQDCGVEFGLLMQSLSSAATAPPLRSEVEPPRSRGR